MVGCGEGLGDGVGGSGGSGFSCFQCMCLDFDMRINAVIRDSPKSISIEPPFPSTCVTPNILPPYLVG